jgi:hypothetical protein
MEDKTAPKLDFRKIYELLSKDFPKDAIQRSEGGKTGKGYDTTGFGYQFAVNRFNEVLGIGGWNWEFKELERGEGSYKSGTKFVYVTGQATITVKVNDGEISHTEYGGHQSNNITDALKGASTNAFKKTAAFFGVGKQAFEKSIDEDNTAVAGSGKGNEIKNVKPAVPAENKNREKGKLEDTILMINDISDLKTLKAWEERLESTKAWTEIQKRVIRNKIEDRRKEIIK